MNYCNSSLIKLKFQLDCVKIHLKFIIHPFNLSFNIVTAENVHKAKVHHSKFGYMVLCSYPAMPTSGYFEMCKSTL